MKVFKKVFLSFKIITVLHLIKMNIDVILRIPAINCNFIILHIAFVCINYVVCSYTIPLLNM